MYEQSYGSNVDDDQIGSALQLPKSLHEYVPNLALALSGRAGSKKSKTPPIAPATLIIFARDGGIGFVLAPKESPRNAHGFVREPSNLLDQIESEIEQGRIGWKPASKKRS